MKKCRVLAMMLVVVVVVATMSTAVFAVDPPSNSKVRVTEKTVSATFSESQEKVWDIWDTQGNFGSYTTAGDMLNITGGTVPFVTLSGFGSNLKDVNEIVVEYKTNDKLTIQLGIREKGSSAVVELPATNGQLVKTSISMAQFEGGALTAEDLKNFASNYDSAAGKYTSTAMLYLGSSNASIKSLTGYWYSYSTESNQIRKTITEDFSKKNDKGNYITWGSWGKWTGSGTTEVPIEMEWIDGANEDGIRPALRIRGGNTGSGSYACGQIQIPNGWDLTAIDAFQIRYKSTAGINVYFNRAYQVESGDKLTASEVDAVKGILGDNYSATFDENGKNISGKKWEYDKTKSSGYNLKNSDGEWVTETIPMSKMGDQPFLKTLKTVIANQSFVPCMQLRFEGCTYGDFEKTGKEFYFGGFTGVWYDKLPTMNSLEFVSGGFADEYLEPGQTDVKVELKNESDVAIEDSVLVAALYDGAKLIDMDIELVDTPALGTSGVKTLSVNLDVDEVTDDHKVCVMLWDSASSMNQITNLAKFDACGYMEQQ